MFHVAERMIPSQSSDANTPRAMVRILMSLDTYTKICVVLYMFNGESQALSG